jgi:hypothetical protein
MIRFLAAFALFAALDASAAYVAIEGRGQALIYPYYTVQNVGGNQNNTFISIVNRTTDSKVLRVRFREGRNGREVGVFNLYLAGNDSWAAAVVPNGDGARLVTVDVSCTNPAFAADSGTLTHLDFTNVNYGGTLNDGLGTGLDRTREGYVEVIEMATLTGGGDTSVRPPGPNSTVPANCPAVQGAPTLVTNAPSGGLSGTLTVINVNLGMLFSVNATAIADLASHPFYRNYNDPYPDFNSAEVDPVTNFMAQGKVYRIGTSSGLDAVAIALMSKSIGSETVLDSATRSGTDWVMTMPLARLQRPTYTVPRTYPALTTDGIKVALTWQARDAGSPIVIASQCPAPCPTPYQAPLSLPWASTVWSFATGSAAGVQATTSSTALGSANAFVVTLPTAAQDGQGSLSSFNPAASVGYTGSSIGVSNALVNAENGPATGLPIIGFMVETFLNGTLSCGSATCQGNYGGTFPHTTSRF